LGYRTSESGKIAVYHDFKQYAWYFTTGVNIKISDPWVLQPSALLQYDIPSGLIADAGASVIYKDVLRVGCSYRSKQALVFILDCKLNYQLHAGLAYDYGMNGINEYNRNSFEIVLEYNFGFQVKASNPTLF
jgi:type IX secretion system PorP/SprF family membrane protein